MPTLFTPTKIKSLAIPNRFIRSATWEGMAAENGECTSQLVDLMADLARGNPGLIISGHAYVSPAGQATSRQLGVDHNGRIQGLSKIAAVGTDEDVKPFIGSETKVLNLKGKTLLPGINESHMHAPSVFMQIYGSELSTSRLT